MYKKYDLLYFSYKKEFGMVKDGNGKYLFGICKVGEKGQIVIPKDARKVFDIKPGDSVVLLGDAKKGLAIVKAEVFASVTDEIIGG